MCPSPSPHENRNKLAIEPPALVISSFCSFRTGGNCFFGGGSVSLIPQLQRVRVELSIYKASPALGSWLKDCSWHRGIDEMTFTPTLVLWGSSSIQSRPCAPTVYSCSLACVPLPGGFVSLQEFCFGRWRVGEVGNRTHIPWTPPVDQPFTWSIMLGGLGSNISSAT